MFYKKKGFPEVGDIVLCTVKKIILHSVFVSFDEYDNLEGMVHISEVAPGRIRNLRDFVKEDKKIVCKVLNINASRNIDLSLRRVNMSQKLDKLNEMKQEEKAEKLLAYIGDQLKEELKNMFNMIGYKAIEKFGTLNDFFETIVVEGEKTLDDFKLSKKVKDTIVEIVQDKIKLPQVTIGGIIKLVSYEPSGVDDIKKVLSGIETEDVHLSYIGAPNYKMDITGSNYKTVENILKNIIDELTIITKKLKMSMEFMKND